MTEVAENRIVLVLYVFPDGRVDGWYDFPPEGRIPVDVPNEFYDQVWQFPGWSLSPSNIRRVENEWRAAELAVLSAQLEALEEADAGFPPVDLLPGTRGEWLRHRGLVRNWVEGNGGYPDTSKRPKRPH